MNPWPPLSGPSCHDVALTPLYAASPSLPLGLQRIFSHHNAFFPSTTHFFPPPASLHRGRQRRRRPPSVDGGPPVPTRAAEKLQACGAAARALAQLSYCAQPRRDSTGVSGGRWAVPCPDGQLRATFRRLAPRGASSSEARLDHEKICVAAELLERVAGASP